MMSIDTRKPPTLEAADLRAVLDHAFHGKPLDPDVDRRVQERAEKVRVQLRKKGTMNIAVDLIREFRDE